MKTIIFTIIITIITVFLIADFKENQRQNEEFTKYRLRLEWLEMIVFDYAIEVKVIDGDIHLIQDDGTVLISPEDWYEISKRVELLILHD